MGKPNAIALTRAAASRNKGVVAKVRCHRHKYVQQLRGTRKGGYVFDLLFEVGFGGWKGKCNLVTNQSSI